MIELPPLPYGASPAYGYTEAEMLAYGEACARAAMETAAEVRRKYDELLLAVGNKYAGETRHETALRYIRRQEAGSGSWSARSSTQSGHQESAPQCHSQSPPERPR
jgi:hypothetical protein